VTFDLYAWKSPRDLDVDGVEALLDGWHESGGDPGTSPFEPSSDVGWFYRELMQDAPGLEASSDAVLSGSTAPIWLAATPEPPARVVGMRLSPATQGDTLELIFGLAAKYDLIVFDTRSRRVHLPLREIAAHASATFWPSGAIQAAVAGGIGGVIAAAAWFLGIPLLSGVLVLAGGFMVVMPSTRSSTKAERRRRTPTDEGAADPTGRRQSPETYGASRCQLAMSNAAAAEIVGRVVSITIRSATPAGSRR
jgi:hypothetical protein